MPVGKLRDEFEPVEVRIAAVERAALNKNSQYGSSHLATEVKNRFPTISIESIGDQDASDDKLVTIRVRDLESNKLKDRFCIRTFVSESKYGAISAVDSVAVVSGFGQLINTIVSGGDLEWFTNADGILKLNWRESTAGTEDRYIHYIINGVTVVTGLLRWIN